MNKADQRGSVTAFVAVIITAIVLVIGLVVDGGALLTTKRRAVNLAEAAARAGAQGIDETTIRAGGPVRLDPAAARRRAERYLAEEHVTGRVTATVTGVHVEITINQPLMFLGIAGLASRTVTGQADARPARGIQQEGD